MQIRNIFHKEITRDIKGVIKIGQDDDGNISQELEEYVVTRELSKHFSEFFESYTGSINDYTDKMGVWISGFFGSGKSHFLKILSYLLENKEVNGKNAIDYFDDKIEDTMVLADMERVGQVTTDVVLFNIDSKSDSDSKSNKDAIVNVFMKVFNEIQGFCASLPWVADLERQLVKDGTYEEFNEKFESLSGSTWIDAREDFYFEEDNIIKALSETTKMSEDASRSWYNKSEENYSLSIEKFANRVKEYIESKGNNHHVVFLADEMGQYIGDDVGLMLNLQTVVEDLGTYCGGKAWVIVTSQQDIDSITKVKGNDFSKIQGRFNTRLNLSSANVDEVIKKRILRKSDVAIDTLKILFSDKEAILKNLINFSSDTPDMKIYKSEEDFVDVYPFIPYQFNLLQSVFTGIRLHGASGKHLSEGERSLLSAFQESAILNADKELGSLIPFSTFYETVEAFLDSGIRTVIIRAEDNENLIKEDVEILKMLFMIKYVKEMPANIENIATLMIKNIDDDKIELKKHIEDSLKRLIKQTLIQKNGIEYIFLTHEEQDVNKEIQNINVDVTEIILKIGEEIFEGIYDDRKFKYNTKYHFDFNKIIDDRLLSQQKSEMGLKIITPYFDTGEELNDQELKMMSTRENNLIIKLPPNTAFLEEMKTLLQIQSYIKRTSSGSSTSEIEEIRMRKSREASERKTRINNLIIESLKSAEIYANGQKLDIKPKNPIERINEGFNTLIESMYNKLNYITEFIDGNKDLNDILLEDNMQIKLTDDIPNKLAVDEVDGYIERNTERNIPMTIKSIISLYSKPSYGWNDLDTLGIVLRLFKMQEVNLQLGSEYLNTSDKELINYLTKRDSQDRLMIKKRLKTPTKYINNVKELSKEVFETTGVPSDEDGLMNRFKTLCESELNKRSTDTGDYGIYFLLEEYKNNPLYPGKEILENGQEILEEIIKINDLKEFYEKVYELKDDFTDYAEDVDDVKKFFKNNKEQFDKAVHQLNIYEKNRSYVLDKDTIDNIDSIEMIVKLKEPYNQIHKLPNLIQNFIEGFTELLEQECAPIKTVIELDHKSVMNELEIYDFKDELESSFDKQFKDLIQRLDSANNFYEAIAMKEESDRLKIRLFNEIQEESKRRKPKPNIDGTEVIEPKADGGNGGYKVKTIKNISINNILRGAKIIETDDDIEEIINELRKKLQQELNEDTKLKLI